jgi:anti-sigma regulatory factor (Ser/Thr protein kinase)
LRSFSWDTTLGLETLDEARAWIVDRVSACAMGGQLDLLSVEIAGGEILQNIVRYANKGSGPVTLRVSDLCEAVAITVFDEAPPSDPNSWDNERAPIDGGLGLPVIKNAVDACSFRPLPAGNRASIYFFPGMSQLGEKALVWAGELLEARAAGESLGDWVGICIASSALPARIADALDTCVTEILCYESDLVSVPDYHNSRHFLDVLISVIHWIESDPSLSVTDRVALVIAALMHDFKHPGGLMPKDGRTVEEVSRDEFEALFSGKGPLTPGEVDKVGELILDSHPSRRNETNLPELSATFNALDMGPSVIPWYGVSLAEAILSEQSMEADSAAFYRNFIEGSRFLLAGRGPFLPPWLDLCLRRVGTLIV